MRTVLTAKKLLNGTTLLDNPVVCIFDGRIAANSTRALKPIPRSHRPIGFSTFPWRFWLPVSSMSIFTALPAPT
jgi:hypothetical protein